MNTAILDRPLYLVECSAPDLSLGPTAPTVVSWEQGEAEARRALADHLSTGCAAEHRIMVADR